MLLFLLASVQLAHAHPAEFRKRANLYADEYSAEDVAAEREVGRNLAARFLNYFRLVENPGAQRYINSLGAFVAARVGRPELTYHFAIVESNDINAYALPGGYIFLTTAAMKAAGSEAALLGVLAHEMAHVNERHVVKELGIRGQSFWAGALGAIGGAQTQAFQKFLESAAKAVTQILLRSGLPQRQEHSADAYALNFLASMGFDPASYISLLRRLDESEKQLPARVVRVTHPAFKERIKRLEEFRSQIGELPKVGTDPEYEKRYQSISQSL